MEPIECFPDGRVRIKDITYSDKYEASRSVGIRYAEIDRRLNRGKWPLEEAWGIVPHVRKIGPSKPRFHFTQEQINHIVKSKMTISEVASYIGKSFAATTHHLKTHKIKCPSCHPYACTVCNRNFAPNKPDPRERNHYCSTECKKTGRKRWLKEYKEHYNVEWALANPEKAAKARQRWVDHGIARAKHKFKTDPIFRLQCALRARLYIALKSGGYKKESRTEKLLGAPFQTVYLHLTKMLLPGMTWDNYGKWHVDHIEPCASFDLSKIENQLLCFHYTNLQPLWARDNIIKSDRLDWIPSLTTDQETANLLI